MFNHLSTSLQNLLDLTPPSKVFFQIIFSSMYICHILVSFMSIQCINCSEIHNGGTQLMCELIPPCQHMFMLKEGLTEKGHPMPESEPCKEELDILLTESSRLVNGRQGVG